jgi:uncharacterized protein YqfA (UPF0365 family)
MIIFLIILAVTITVIFFWYYAPLDIWYKAKLSGINPGLMNLAKMRLQKIPQDLIISILIKAKNSGLRIEPEDLMKKYLSGIDISLVTETAIQSANAGIHIPYNDLARQYLAKVDIQKVVYALITLHHANLSISFETLCNYYLSNINIIELCDAYISANNAGYSDIDLNTLKEHYLSGGNVKKTVEAYISAREAAYNDITFREIKAIDLTDIDVIQAVNWSINPKVIETKTITGITADGIQLHMKLKLTLRANLKNLIGGATEQTVLARVDEHISSEIGNTLNHREVLKSPYILAKKVEQKELGKGTAFDIISIDVSEITVGKDIQAELLSERAKANAEKAKADYIKAEEKVQKAMAAAFIDGNINVTDYQNIKNSEADTEMRKKISDSFDKKEE